MLPTRRRRVTAYVGLANALELDLEFGARRSLTRERRARALRRTSFVVRDQDGTVIAAATRRPPAG